MTSRAPRDGMSLVELIVVIGILGTLMGLLLPAVQRVREVSNRSRCLHNLRQLGLALHHYHDALGSLPPGAGLPNRTDDLAFAGWALRILPYVEQDALWLVSREAFRRSPLPFDNPPHVGMDFVLPVLTCPSDDRVFRPQVSYGYQVGLSSYLGVTGSNHLTYDGLLYQGSRVRLTEVTDGTSGTLLVGERPPSSDLFYGWWYAGRGQNNTGSGDMVLSMAEVNYRDTQFWGCPRGPYSYGPGRRSNQCDLFHFWSLHSGGGGSFLFADGSVRSIA